MQKRFEDMEQQEKEQLIKEYYSWLFEIPVEEIELEREIEYSFARTYEDPYIYYPKLMGDLYRTDSMQRMGRISQLGSKIIGDGASKQNRSDHCKHTAYLRLEESIYLWRDSGDLYKAIVKKNKLKKFLFAEEIKAGLHDIGHSPFSHEMENALNNFAKEFQIEDDDEYKNSSDFILLYTSNPSKVTHEDIGKMYIKNDAQINEILSRIPGLKNALLTVIDEDIFNNKSHSEGNFDVDRKSYMLRDALFYGNPADYIYPMYKRLFFEKGTHKQITDPKDANIDLSNIDIIDVYDTEDYDTVLNFLQDRVAEYKERLYSPLCQVENNYIEYFLKTVYMSQDKTTAEITKYIDTYLKLIKYRGLRKEDYDFFRSFDEIKMYSNILNIAQNAENDFLKQVTTMMLPEIRVFMDMIADMLENSNQQKKLESSPSNNAEQKIVEQIYSIIHKDNDLLRRIKNRNYLRENVIIVKDVPPEVIETYGENIFTHSRKKIRIYDESEPLFFLDSNGEIKKIENHSKCPNDLNLGYEYVDVYYCIIPELISQRNEQRKNTEFKRYGSRISF